TAMNGDKVVARIMHEGRQQRGDAQEARVIKILERANSTIVGTLQSSKNFFYVIPDDSRLQHNIYVKPPDQSGPRSGDNVVGKFVITIDPDDAKDFDDAIDVERTKNGWNLGVHIADVSHYVRPGNALDREAKKRGNSTYLADRVIPMLPERLSNGICSLRPGVDRLTTSAFIDFDRSGAIKKTRFAKTVIHSAARLTYRQAFAILENKPVPP